MHQSPVPVPTGPGNSGAFNFSVFKVLLNALHCRDKFMVKFLLKAPSTRGKVLFIYLFIYFCLAMSPLSTAPTEVEISVSRSKYNVSVIGYSWVVYIKAAVKVTTLVIISNVYYFLLTNAISWVLIGIALLRRFQ